MTSTKVTSKTNSKVSQYDSFTVRVMDCLDELYTTAVRLTKDMPKAEQLVQTTLEKGAKIYKPESSAVIRVWLLEIMTQTYYASAN